MLSKKQEKNNRTNLEGFKVYFPDTPATTVEFDCREAPTLNTYLPYSQVTVKPTDVVIKKDIETVWKCLLDFDSYKFHNPFHRAAKIITVNDEYYLEMKITLPNVLGGSFTKTSIEIDPNDPNLSTQIEKIYYIDHQRHILCYGLNSTVICMRSVYMYENENKETVFCSWDTMAGVGGLAVKMTGSDRFLTDAFQSQHQGFKEWIEKYF
jgi:hypothetical protein